MLATDATEIRLIRIDSTDLLVEFAGQRHSVDLVRGGWGESPVYFCGAHAARWRYVSGPQAGEQITPQPVIDALESLDQEVLQDAIDALYRAYRDDVPATPIALALCAEAA